MVQMLRCKLTGTEVFDKGKHLADEEIKLDNLKEDLKEHNLDQKSIIKVSEAMVKKLSREVSTEEEEREVETEWFFHKPVGGMKQLVRLDIHEVIEEKDMTDYDKAQHHLSLQGTMELN